MKKLISLFAAAAMIFAGIAPAQAGIVWEYDSRWVGQSYPATWSTMNVNGSLREGEAHTVSFSATIPTGATCEIWIVAIGGILYNTQGNTGAVSGVSNSIVSGAAGTQEQYWTVFHCTQAVAPTFAGYSSRIAQVTFEAAPQLGAPTNFIVSAQTATTAFATWGIANGATGYTVTATPGGATCTTAQNFCVISGLTAGETYNFSVVATSGSATGLAVSSGPVLLREPVIVAVFLSNLVLKAGETATAQYSLQGTSANPTITWYRCNSTVGAMPTPPSASDCSSVGSGASYTLTAGDVGKYVTAHVFVNNTDPQGQMTAVSNTAVLASGAVAPAPVADPAGKPTIVNIPNPIVSVAGGTQVTITGTGLAGVTSVTIGGVPALVVSKTDTTVVVQVPNSTKVGLADLTVTNAQGSVTSKSAIVYTTNPVLKITKTKSISGFTASSKALTSAQKSAVKSLITANPTLTQLSCAAKTVGVAASKSELAKAKSLATVTCAYAKSLKKTLVTSASASQSLPKSKASRSVLLTLKN